MNPLADIVYLFEILIVIAVLTLRLIRHNKVQGVVPRLVFDSLVVSGQKYFLINDYAAVTSGYHKFTKTS